MKILYDTSVLVPAVVETHQNHSLTLPQIEKARRKDIFGFLSAHTLAELYSVLTRLPAPHRVDPSQVPTIIKDLLEFLEPVTLSAKSYQLLINQLAELQLTGGIVFDALIGQAALNAKVDYLVTLNPKDFRRLGPEVSALVFVPGEDTFPERTP